MRAFLLVLGALPFVVWLASWSPVLRPLVDAADVWFSLHCHRIPARTLELAGRRLPVCARCTGLYAGLFLGAALPPPAIPFPRFFAAIGAFGAILGLDVLTEALGWRVPGLGVRFVTGVTFSYVAAAAATRSAGVSPARTPLS